MVKTKEVDHRDSTWYCAMGSCKHNWKCKYSIRDDESILFDERLKMTQREIDEVESAYSCPDCMDCPDYRRDFHPVQLLECDLPKRAYLVLDLHTGEHHMVPMRNVMRFNEKLLKAAEWNEQLRQIDNKKHLRSWQRDPDQLTLADVMPMDELEKMEYARQLREKFIEEF